MSTNESAGLSQRRLETLTDGIYAIAMTLLVLNLMIPVLSVVAVLITFVSPGHSNMVYLVAVFIKPALTRKARALRAAQP